jgi:hypothetical protein
MNSLCGCVPPCPASRSRSPRRQERGGAPSAPAQGSSAGPRPDPRRLTRGALPRLEAEAGDARPLASRSSSRLVAALAAAAGAGEDGLAVASAAADVFIDGFAVPEARPPGRGCMR